MFTRRKGFELTTAQAAERDRRLQRFIEDAWNFKGVDAADAPEMRLRTMPDERVFLCAHGAHLIELVEGAREAPSLDRGEFTVTTTRAVFRGSRQVRQWHWSKLGAIEHASLGPWTAIRVVNRRRVFGVLYDERHLDEFRFGIDLAVANAQHARYALIGRLTQEQDAIRAAYSLTTS
jgi:hypothetical protein